MRKTIGRINDSQHGKNKRCRKIRKDIKKREQRQKAQTEKIDSETLTVKKSIPNMIIIPDEKTGKPQILVNKRTGAVSKIEPTDNHSIIKTTSIGTKPLYSRTAGCHKAPGI